MNIRNFSRKYSNWTYHTIYTDETKTKTKNVIDWNGKRYDINRENEEHNYPWFIANNTIYELKGF